jgi:NAD(P)-dependent dehydrogenase (short-subunit alcohol dehydrogenase family)
VREVAGKIAFVTGGACGIGLGMATAFLDAGMKVIVADIRRSHLDEAESVLADYEDVRFLELDVANRAAVFRAADETEAMFGRIHLLCNNAGVGAVSDIADDDFALWDWLMAINVGGVVNGIKAFLPKLRAHGEGGHIVNTASMAAFLPISGDTSAYSSSKAAVMGITDALRLTVAADNIGVSLLCPSIVRTRAMQNLRLRNVPAEGADPRLAYDLSGGMDPLEMGRIALEGIQRNRAYIFGGIEYEQLLIDRFEEILGDLPADRRLAKPALAKLRNGLVAARSAHADEP